MNNVVLIGRLARDPELRFIPSTGMAVAKFNLAVDREMSKDKKQEAQSQGKQTADFIGVTVFGKSAENAANFLKKRQSMRNTWPYKHWKLYNTDRRKEIYN